MGGNSLIKENIISGNPFLATKMGYVEQSILWNRIKNDKIDRVRSQASVYAGITPPTDETIQYFYDRYTYALNNADIIGNSKYSGETDLIKRFAPQAAVVQPRSLEPFYHKDAWSDALVGKRVLVIHPFEESIKAQYAKGFLPLPEFELLTIKAKQTNGGGLKDSEPFIESLLDMQYDVLATDFDVALIGCGAYGLLLAETVKSLGKQAIHIGGGLQIMFGIKGKRWDVHPEISMLYTNDWVRPLDSEKTLNFEEVEKECYW